MCNYEKVENMTTTNILSLLGGLALFLYGMQMMGNGLEAAAGDRLKQILEKLTSNRFFRSHCRCACYGGYSKFRVQQQLWSLDLSTHR